MIDDTCDCYECSYWIDCQVNGKYFIPPCEEDDNYDE